MNGAHQLPTDSVTLVRRINEDTSDHITVEAGGADNVFALYGYQDVTLTDQHTDGFRRKATFNLGDNVRGVIP